MRDRSDHRNRFDTHLDVRTTTYCVDYLTLSSRHKGLVKLEFPFGDSRLIANLNIEYLQAFLVERVSLETENAMINSTDHIFFNELKNPLVGNHFLGHSLLGQAYDMHYALTAPLNRSSEREFVIVRDVNSPLTTRYFFSSFIDTYSSHLRV